jgi:hypothetical protein
MKKFLILALVTFISFSLSSQQMPVDWWKQLNGNIRFAVKAENLTINKIKENIDSLYRCGYRIIEIFAPSEGGELYHGLAVKDFYKIDPSVGSEADLFNLINACHKKGMAIIGFINPGYCSIEAPFFIKACEDVKNGIVSKESKWFLWSESGKDTLTGANNYFKQQGKWVYSELAGKYFFTKWKGQPQFNFGSSEWQQECKNVIRYYMSFGYDGLIIDAPNFYINCNWDIIKSSISDIIHETPGKFSQPEGAGAFGDDPIQWITNGGFTGVQNYGLGIWWDHVPIVAASVEMGSPCVLETRLKEYRDKINAVNGVCYFYPFWDKPLWPARRLVEIAFLASSGNLFTFAGGTGGYTGSEVAQKWKPEEREKYFSILNQVNSNPALGPFGQRIKLSTQDDSRYYAFIRISEDKKHKVLVVLNFQGPADIKVDMKNSNLKGVKSVKNLGNPEQVIMVNKKQVVISLPWLGWGFYEIE